MGKVAEKLSVLGSQHHGRGGGGRRLLSQSSSPSLSLSLSDSLPLLPPHLTVNYLVEWVGGAVDVCVCVCVCVCRDLA